MFLSTKRAISSRYGRDSYSRGKATGIRAALAKRLTARWRSRLSLFVLVKNRRHSFLSGSRTAPGRKLGSLF
jgi:hypothetical protein